MAIGASGPAPGSITVLPTVKTRKKVPINSTKYFLITKASGTDGLKRAGCSAAEGICSPDAVASGKDFCRAIPVDQLEPDCCPSLIKMRPPMQPAPRQIVQYVGHVTTNQMGLYAVRLGYVCRARDDNRVGRNPTCAPRIKHRRAVGRVVQGMHSNSAS